MVPVPVDLNELTDVVKISAIKIDVYNTKIKYIEDKITDITILATNNKISIIK